jgi:RND family efflux transporter MFP subunit
MKTTTIKKLGGLSRSHRILLLALLMGALVVIVAGVVFGREEKPTVTAIPPRLVRAFTVIPAAVMGAEFTGVIHARTESDLGFRVPGKIIEKRVKAGDQVKRGQALMRLDPTDLQLAANSAQAAVGAARAQNKRARADEQRLRELVAINAISIQEYDRAKSTADATSAQLNAALAYSSQLENQVNYAVLKAEADGVIMAVPADVGQVVAAGTLVLRLAHAGPREAVVNLPEGDAQLVRSTAVASLYTDPGQTFPAKLRELSAQADPLTRTYQARYQLGGNGENAPLGATVTVNLAGETAKEARPLYEIPVGALYDGGAGASVWVIDPGTSSLSHRAVKVAKLGSETALVDNGLKPGERILALGAHLVQDGERVKILPGTAKEQKL